MDNSLKILDSEKAFCAFQEIEINPTIIQLDLAQKLEISLLKFNFLIKSLIELGHNFFISVVFKQTGFKYER
jgi:hypothetical protein